jgi:hypothetical protein
MPGASDTIRMLQSIKAGVGLCLAFPSTGLAGVQEAVCKALRLRMHVAHCPRLGCSLGLAAAHHSWEGHLIHKLDLHLCSQAVCPEATICTLHQRSRGSNGGRPARRTGAGENSLAAAALWRPGDLWQSHSRRERRVAHSLHRWSHAGPMLADRHGKEGRRSGTK